MENSSPDSYASEESKRENSEESIQLVDEKGQDVTNVDEKCTQQTQDEDGEQVLVEKDGKFELVNASEVNAHWSPQSIQTVLEAINISDVGTMNDVLAEHGEEKAGNVKSTCIRETEAHNEVDVHPPDEEIRRILDELKAENSLVTSGSGNDNVHCDTEMTRALVSEPALQSLVSPVLQSEREVSVHAQNVLYFPSGGHLAASSINHRKEKLKYSNGPSNQQQDNEAARRLQAQEAFRAWLSAKKEQKKAKLQSTRIAMEMQQGFSWTARSQASREDCDARFGEWLQEKKRQRHRELQLQTRQQQLLDEEIVKPSEHEIETAYKR